MDGIAAGGNDRVIARIGHRPQRKRVRRALIHARRPAQGDRRGHVAYRESCGRLVHATVAVIDPHGQVIAAVVIDAQGRQVRPRHRRRRSGRIGEVAVAVEVPPEGKCVTVVVPRGRRIEAESVTFIDYVRPVRVGNRGLIPSAREIAGQSKVIAAPLVQITGRNDLVIRLDGDAEGSVRATDEVGGYPPVTIKGRIQGPVAVVAGQGKVVARITRQHNPLIRLEGDAEAPVQGAAEVGGDLPITIKGRIQAAVAVVAGQAKVTGGGPLVRMTPQHDPAIRLDSHAAGNIGQAGEVGGDLSIIIKGSIQAAVAVVAGQGKVIARITR